MDNAKYIRDLTLLEIAKETAKSSQDPSTKVGCVIVDDANGDEVVGYGYNDFPVGLKKRDVRFNNREEKYNFVIHAEINAVINALMDSETDNLFGYTAYVTHAPCCSCMAVMAQVGIKKVVVEKPLDTWTDRFPNSYRVASEIREDCGIEYVEIGGRDE